MSAQPRSILARPIRLKPYLPLIGILVFASLFWSALFARTFRTLSSPDQLDYAQIARNLVRGEGFTTQLIAPLYLTRFPVIENHPEFLRAPGFSALVALAQLIFGPRDEASVVLSGLAFVLSAGLAYVLSKELFQSELLAVFTSILIIFNQEMAQNSQNGLADITFAFYLTLLILALVKQWPAWAQGILIGLGYLLRYNFLWMLPGVWLYWWWTRPGDIRRHTALALGTALLVAAPWALRNLMIAGSPVFTWPSFQYVMGTATYPNQDLYRQIETVEITQFVLTHPGEMLSKTIAGARLLYNGLPQVANFYIVAFFVVSAFSRLGRDSRAGMLQSALFVMAACQALALLPLEHEKIRLFLAFIPVMIVFAAQFFFALLGQFNLSRLRLIGALIGAIAVVAIPTLPEFTGLSYRSDFETAPADLRASDAAAHPEALVISDAAAQIAWYLDRTSVGLPKTEADLRKIEALAPGPIYVFIFYIGGYDRYERAEEYAEQYIENPEFLARYELIQSYETGALLYRKRVP